MFYINDNMVCLENIIYGAVISLLLIAVIQWCSVAASYLSSEKMMYLFGSFIPSVGMIFSMILRMIPLMRTYMTRRWDFEEWRIRMAYLKKSDICE